MKKANKQQLTTLLMRNDQRAREQFPPDATDVVAEEIRKQQALKKMELEQESTLAELRRKVKEADVEREQQVKEADYARRMQELAAAESSKRLQLQIPEAQQKVQQPESPSPLASKRWERVYAIYKDNEDIEEFLATLKCICSVNWIPDEWRMPVLMTRLTGKAREVFNDMGEEEALDYGQFKDYALKRFRVTPEPHWVKFRSFKMSSDCTYVECAHKLMGFVKRWVMGAKVNGNYEQLLDLLTLEQFLNVVPDQVRAAVCDREPESVLRAAEIADAHTQNRAQDGHRPLGKTQNLSPQFRPLVPNAVPAGTMAPTGAFV
uniref:SCAN box domain-containing protein n=1 Tax=Pelodiscus sinensis TaxID=13735 RepID=K7EXU3_PELSI